MASAPSAPAALSSQAKTATSEARAAFDDFVGQTFFTQLLSQMRKTVEKPAYFHGGQTEEVFQGQLDQVLAEKLSDATAEQFSGPMFDLFMLRR
ncbi:MAG: rod-binding protein [Pirellulaceae bacterium]|nr:rod-binding protein [Pirellulaceae bacterium]